MLKKLNWLVGALFALTSFAAHSSIITVTAPADADPGTSFNAQVFLNDIMDLGGFEFILNFDSSVLTATGITSGDIFGVDTFEVDNTLGAGTASFSEITTALSGVNVTIDTLIATISFDVAAGATAGAASLTLSNVLLSDSAADPIPLNTTNNASVDITGSPSGTAPIPSSLWLLGAGLVLVARRRQQNIPEC